MTMVSHMGSFRASVAQENVSNNATRKQRSSHRHPLSVSPTSHRDNWISRRVTLVCPGCRRDIPSADGGVSFGCGSEARGRKMRFPLLSVKLLLTPCDQKLENRSTVKKKERGVIQGEKTQQQQSLQYRGSLYFCSV